MDPENLPAGILAVCGFGISDTLAEKLISKNQRLQVPRSLGLIEFPSASAYEFYNLLYLRIGS